MKIIYSSPETERQGILVLSLEGLKYTVSFTEMVADQTHIPMFEDKEYYYLADCESIERSVAPRYVCRVYGYADCGNVSNVR